MFVADDVSDVKTYISDREMEMKGRGEKEGWVSTASTCGSTWNVPENRRVSLADERQPESQDEVEHERLERKLDRAL